MQPFVVPFSNCSYIKIIFPHFPCGIICRNCSCSTAVFCTRMLKRLCKGSDVSLCISSIRLHCLASVFGKTKKTIVSSVYFHVIKRNCASEGEQGRISVLKKECIVGLQVFNDTVIAVVTHCPYLFFGFLMHCNRQSVLLEHHWFFELVQRFADAFPLIFGYNHVLITLNQCFIQLSFMLIYLHTQDLF